MAFAYPGMNFRPGENTTVWIYCRAAIRLIPNLLQLHLGASWAKNALSLPKAGLATMIQEGKNKRHVPLIFIKKKVTIKPCIQLFFFVNLKVAAL